MPVPETQQVTSREPERAIPYEHEDTRALVSLVQRASELIRARGEGAFDELRHTGSEWRRGETYVFVLDLEGNMLVHPDPMLEGKRTIDLEDAGGKPIIRGLIAAATSSPDKRDGWYHYQWPMPGEPRARAKSTYVRLVSAPSRKSYIVGSGIYTRRMERAFVVDLVGSAVREVEKRGTAALELFRDPRERFVANEAYLFVMDMNGVELFNAAFPELEGRDLYEMTDTRGKRMVVEMIEVARRRGSGWVDYMWPKPGENVATQKSTYVSRAILGDRPVIVACGVYLE
jgi:signal transduction histidine kinase